MFQNPDLYLLYTLMQDSIWARQVLRAKELGSLGKPEHLQSRDMLNEYIIQHC